MYPLLKLGPLIIPTYYLMISLGSVAGLTWFLARAPSEEEATGINIAFVVLIAGFVGARLLHIFFEAPAIYWRQPLLAFEFWQGGFVYYGGFILGLISGFIYCRRKGLNTRVWLDRASLPVGLSYAIGRIGCFFNGCCYGRICHLPWGVRFPAHLGWGLAVQERHPTQLYAAAMDAVAIGLLYTLERRKFFRTPGIQFWLWLSLHALGRLVMEHWRDDDRGMLIWGWSISSVMSFGLLAFASLRLLRYRASR